MNLPQYHCPACGHPCHILPSPLGYSLDVDYRLKCPKVNRFRDWFDIGMHTNSLAYIKDNKWCFYTPVGII